MFGKPADTLYLIDISSMIFRAYYAIRPMNTQSGEPTNAVYGVAAMLAKLWQEAKPEHLAVLYDSREPSVRKERYADYKANRSAAPESLVPQFDRIEQLIKHMGIPSFRQSRIEADDLIATATRRWLETGKNHKVIIVSGDKDLMSLVGDRVCTWDTMNNKIYREPEVIEKMGVRPDQVRDYLALVGDSSDNIPGVAGIGPKGASELLKEHGSLENILAAARAGKIPGKKGQNLVEFAQDALLSQELATLNQGVAIDWDPGSLHYRFTARDELIAFLEEMNFNSLIPKWRALAEKIEGAGPSATPQASAPASAAPHASAAPDPALRAPGARIGRFITIDTEAKLDEYLAAIRKTGQFGFDLETTSLNPREAELVGVALCVHPDEGAYIPVGHRGTHAAQLDANLVLEKLKPYLEDPRYKKIGQNLKYDWSVLLCHGIQADGIGADTMVASYVLDPEGRHNLEILAEKYLGYAVTTYESVCGKGKDQLGFDQVPIDQATRYSAEDAWVAVKLWETLLPLLRDEGLMQVFAEIDLPLVPLLARMECQGVRIDEPWLRSLGTQFERELREIENKVAAFTSGPINLNSTKQLAHLLFDQLGLPTQSKTKTGYSTDAAVLETLAPLHEVPRLLLEYREIAKLKGTYIDPLPGMRDKKTGKIHASFHQAVAATGRLSSSDPNLQNIPIRTERGRKIRRAFIPSEGNVLLSADYSQIELRLLAHMSGDPDLVGSFLKDEDVHRRTAAEIFGIKPDEVDDRQRGIAKAINFGLMYGKTAFGLAQELKIPRREAQDTIDRYFRRYSGVKRFLDRQVLEAKERGYTLTLLGRKRRLPDINSRNAAIRANAERMAMNAPIQGTAADLMKLAMIEIDHQLTARKLKSKLIIQVHDEVLLDCPRAEATAARDLVVSCMENALTLSVPLRVNASVGENWMDL